MTSYSNDFARDIIGGGSYEGGLDRKIIIGIVVVVVLVLIAGGVAAYFMMSKNDENNANNALNNSVNNALNNAVNNSLNNAVNNTNTGTGNGNTGTMGPQGIMVYGTTEDMINNYCVPSTTHPSYYFCQGMDINIPAAMQSEYIASDVDGWANMCSADPTCEAFNMGFLKQSTGTPDLWYRFNQYESDPNKGIYIKK